MICQSAGKQVVRFLWDKAITEMVHLDPEMYRQPKVLKNSIDPTNIDTRVNPACLWLASDDFSDVLPIAKKFKCVHVPENDSRSKTVKRRNMDCLPDHITVLDGSIKDHLEFPGLDYMTINLDLTGHYNQSIANLVILAMSRLYNQGLLFLTVSTSCRNSRNATDQSRIANGPMGIIADLYNRIPDMDDRLLLVEGFPRSYYGNGKAFMHSFGWMKLS